MTLLNNSTADGIMSVFTKTISKLEKHVDKQQTKRNLILDQLGNLRKDLSDAEFEQDKAEGFIAGINQMMNGGK